MLKINYFLGIFLLAFSSSNVDSQTIGNYVSTACEGYTMNLACSPGYVLNIVYANYGRLLPGRLVCRKFGRDLNTLCFSSNATRIMRSRCNQRNTCAVAASSSIFGDPCRRTYKYLMVTYSCIRYESACENQNMTITCPGGQNIMIINANYGRTLPGSYICQAPSNSSTTALNTACFASNSTMLVSNACNYNTACTVPASNSLFGDPCPGTWKYLEATYYCY